MLHVGCYLGLRIVGATCLGPRDGRLFGIVALQTLCTTYETSFTANFCGTYLETDPFELQVRPRDPQGHTIHTQILETVIS
jgi:hypothetical protein